MGVPADHAHLGDPVGMEMLASELTLRAESISGIATSLERQLGNMTFEGPAADRIRADMDTRRRRAERVSTDLLGAAHALRRSAATVRAQIHELRLAESRREKE